MFVLPIRRVSRALSIVSLDRSSNPARMAFDLCHLLAVLRALLSPQYQLGSLSSPCEFLSTVSSTARYPLLPCFPPPPFSAPLLVDSLAHARLFLLFSFFQRFPVMSRSAPVRSFLIVFFWISAGTSSSTFSSSSTPTFVLFSSYHLLRQWLLG